MTQRYKILATTLLSLSALFLPACSSSGPGDGFNTPACSVSVGALEFGDIIANESSTLSFEISNAGFGTLNGTVTSGCPEFVVFGADYSLTNNRSQTVTVQFTPTSAGAFVCTLATGGECAAVVLTGTGVTSCCTVTPRALDFGSLETGGTGDGTVTLKNCGQETINGTASLSVCDDYTIIAGGGSFMVSPGAAHTVTVRLNANTMGTPTCTLDFGGTACDNVVCRADVGSFSCFVEPNEFVFDSLLVGESSDTVFVIRNLGTVPLTGRIAPGCEDFALVSPEDDEYRLEPDEVMEVRFRFSPVLPGDKDCFFRISTKRGDGGEKPCSDVVVAGRGYEEEDGGP